LVVPHALGQGVRFEDGHGPILDPFAGTHRLMRDQQEWRARLNPVYQAIGQVRAALPRDKALIGFAGAPWTLAAYMLEGKGSPDQRAAKLAAYRDPEAFAKLIDRLVETVAWHLLEQFEAGADVVQIFDSWAGGLPESAFNTWVVEPNRRVVEIVRKSKPTAKIIGFPRAATETGYLGFARSTGVDALSIDTAASMRWAGANLPNHVALQGNLDPIALIAGGAALDRAVDEILAATEGKPFIFNLGHGILPETPPENVTRLVDRIRGRA